MSVQRWTTTMVASDAGGFVSISDYLDMEQRLVAQLDALRRMQPVWSEAQLVAQLDALRRMQPVWSEAQHTYIAALAQLWEELGATNQTRAMLALRALKEGKT